MRATSANAALIGRLYLRLCLPQLIKTNPSMRCSKQVQMMAENVWGEAARRVFAQGLPLRRCAVASEVHHMAVFPTHGGAQ